MDARTDQLCWVDIDNGTLYENDLATGEQFISSLSTLLGVAVLRANADGGCLRMADHVLPEPLLPMNDAKCDSSGRLWAGRSTHVDFIHRLGSLHRYDSTGRLVTTVPIPVEKPPSCAFGEDGMLYLTSATLDLTPENLEQQPLAGSGSVFALNPDTAGVPVQPFRA